MIATIKNVILQDKTIVVFIDFGGIEETMKFTSEYTKEKVIALITIRGQEILEEQAKIDYSLNDIETLIGSEINIK